MDRTMGRVCAGLDANASKNLAYDEQTIEVIGCGLIRYSNCTDVRCCTRSMLRQMAKLATEVTHLAFKPFQKPYGGLVEYRDPLWQMSVALPLRINNPHREELHPQRYVPRLPNGTVDGLPTALP
jgi:hypothetical protein